MYDKIYQVWKVIDASNNDIVGGYFSLDSAIEECKEIWDELDKKEKYKTVVEVICNEYIDNSWKSKHKYQLSTDYKELSDEALVYVDDSLDEYDLDALREIARRCDKLEEFEESEDWEDLIEDCKEYLWQEALKNEGR